MCCRWSEPNAALRQRVADRVPAWLSATLLCGGARRRRGVAGAHQRGAALCRGRPLSPARAQHERRDVAAQPQRRRAIHFAGGRDHARRAGLAARSATACSTASMSPIVRPISPRCRMRARGERAASSSALRRDAARGQNVSADFIWVEMRCRPLEQAVGRGRGGRRDARRHRPQGAGAGARTGAHRRRAGGRVEDPLPGHHEPRAAHAAQRHHRLLRDDRAGRRARCSMPRAARNTRS